MSSVVVSEDFEEDVKHLMHTEKSKLKSCLKKQPIQEE